MTLRTYREAVSVVTGAASGIGLALARALAAEGAHVVMVDRDAEPLETAAEQLRGAGARVETLALDLRDVGAWRTHLERIARDHGRLDQLFSNAGISFTGSALSASLEEWDATFDVNVRAVVHGTWAALGVMRAQGFGHVIATASLAGLIATPFAAAYAASKHAVVGLMTSLRPDVARFGVRSSVICPGFVSTPIVYGGTHGRAGFSRETVDAYMAQLGVMAPEALAKNALPRLARGEGLIVEPRGLGRLVWLLRVFPWLADRVAARDGVALLAKELPRGG